jgi:hypothetical protein
MPSLSSLNLAYGIWTRAALLVVELVLLKLTQCNFLFIQRGWQHWGKMVGWKLIKPPGKARNWMLQYIIFYTDIPSVYIVFFPP